MIEYAKIENIEWGIGNEGEKDAKGYKKSTIVNFWKEHPSINYFPLFIIGVINLICVFIKHVISQNEPNFPFSKIAITPLFLRTMDYGLKTACGQNEPNRTQIQSQYKPNFFVKFCFYSLSIIRVNPRNNVIPDPEPGPRFQHENAKKRNEPNFRSSQIALTSFQLRTKDYGLKTALAKTKPIEANLIPQLRLWLDF